MTVFYARMCNLWNAGDREGVGGILEKSLCYVITVSLAMGGLLVLVGADVFSILFRYTRFTSEGIADLITYSNILMISYLFLAIGGVISRLFYAAGCSLRVSLLDCLGTFFYALAAFSLVRVFKGTGLAIAASIYSIFVVSLFVGWAYRQFRTRLRREFLATIGAVFLRWTGVFALAMLFRRLVLQGFPASFASALAALLYLGGLALVIRFAQSRTGALRRDLTHRESDRTASLDVFRE
jgi:peptidoglycan biosynthesis protein MviN/MurJ (putative lipid II flippase)